MLTNTDMHLEGRLTLESSVRELPNGDQFGMIRIHEGNRHIWSASIFVVPEDIDRIAEAVAAFNEVMQRPSLLAAAE